MVDTASMCWLYLIFFMSSTSNAVTNKHYKTRHFEPQGWGGIKE